LVTSGFNGKRTSHPFLSPSRRGSRKGLKSSDATFDLDCRRTDRSPDPNQDESPDAISGSTASRDVSTARRLYQRRQRRNSTALSQSATTSFSAAAACQCERRFTAPESALWQAASPAAGHGARYAASPSDLARGAAASVGWHASDATTSDCSRKAARGTSSAADGATTYGSTAAGTTSFRAAAHVLRQRHASVDQSDESDERRRRDATPTSNRWSSTRGVSSAQSNDASDASYVNAIDGAWNAAHATCAKSRSDGASAAVPATRSGSYAEPNSSDRRR